MPILTSTGSYTVGDAAVSQNSTTVTVLPAATTQTGRGRLIHPSLGTLDYPYMPDKWVNIDGDVIVSPIWSNTKTLLGSSNTLFVGHIRDVQCEEHWNQEITNDLDFVRTLLAFWMNPPDPSVAYVQWWPSYTTTLGYKVILSDLKVGDSSGVSLNHLTRLDVVEGSVALKLRIVDRMP